MPVTSSALSILTHSQEDRLMISDPKALQYVHQTAAYHFPKQPERRVISEAIAGRGIIWAEGNK